eukprot:gene26244-29642_t
MCLVVVVTLLLFAPSVQGLSFLKVNVPPETVREFDPDAFVGRWYQMYASLIPNITYEKDGFCEFRLTFDAVKSPVAGFFWIVYLGAIEPGQTQYPYAIVSVPFQTSLFILARDVEEFRLKYKDVVLELVKDMGYTYFFNKPIETYHSAACNYPPSLERAFI